MIKHLLSLSFAIATGLTASAQITVSQGDIAAIGTEIHQAQDTMPAAGIGPGPAGANLTWNFAALNTHTIDTLVFTNPNWTAFASSFPTSNLAAEMSNGVAYLEINSNGLWNQGQGDPSANMVQVFNPDELIVPFPATFGTNYTNSYSYTIKDAYTAFPGFDSVMVKHDVNKTGMVDAWGNLITPLGTFNTIRASEVQNHTDTVWLRSTGPFPPAGWTMVLDSAMTIHHYKWWANGVGFPLAEMDSTSAGGVERVSWLMATPVVTGLEPLTLAPGHVYPNPASETVNITLKPVDATKILVYDPTGRLVKTSDVSGSFNMLPVNDLADGIYFFVAAGNNGNALQKGKFTVKR